MADKLVKVRIKPKVVETPVKGTVVLNGTEYKYDSEAKKEVELPQGVLDLLPVGVEYVVSLPEPKREKAPEIRFGKDK